MTNQQMDKLLEDIFQHLTYTKDSCKVMVSHSLKAPDMNMMNSLMRSCLETGDTVDLCKLFIINHSPNTKKCVEFTMFVIKNTMNECKKLNKNNYCKKTCSFGNKTLKDTYDLLNKLHKQI